MNRRAFIGTLGIGPLAAALAGEAQPVGKTPPGKFRIGFLLPDRGGEDALVEALKALGYVEGQNITIERRYTQGNRDTLPALAAELVALSPAVIFVVSGYYAAAARQATTTIPIVTIAGDLVAEGLVASLARPGGNITGFQVLQPDTARKRVALLKEAIPGLSRVGLLFGPVGQWFYDGVSQETQSAAQPLRLKIHIVQARAPADLVTVFSALQKDRAEAVLITADPFTIAHRKRLSDLAASYRLAGMCDLKVFVEAGSLMSYGANHDDIFRHAATYVDKILKGAKPGDLPIEQPTKFELVINLKTAKALGLTIPPSLLLRADQVIE